MTTVKAKSRNYNQLKAEIYTYKKLLENIDKRREHIFDRHEEILKNYSRNKTLTAQEQTELDATQNRLAVLSQREGSYLTTLQKMGQKVDGFAAASINQLDRFKSAIDSIANHQSPGIFTVLLGIPVGYFLLALETERHNKLYPQNQYGYSLAPKERGALTKAVNKGRKLGLPM